ncbi:MAG TPA: RNA 2',3'-cyclic phosphodiesterase [Pyrinomonadaceae bacterium]|nr:RNA 2',3'-cyclic phosphodiesterase [Pyrinomonadaceae bacterium]
MRDEWRIFCAVELPDAVRARLQSHIAQLREAVPEVAASWTRVENIHLTLKFFGNVATERIPKISAAVERAIKKSLPFTIGVGKTGVFPNPRRAQVLWIRVNDPAGKLSELQGQLENECAKEGFERENRAYHPHLTIARLRKPEGARLLADAHLNTDFEPVEIPLSELIVFRSELSSKGSKYTAISQHILTGLQGFQQDLQD